jgi:hypothetical protein
MNINDHDVVIPWDNHTYHSLIQMVICQCVRISQKCMIAMGIEKAAKFDEIYTMYGSKESLSLIR